MTEAEWFASTDPQLMLQYLRAKASDRKLRLFAVACCRRIWHLLEDERSKKAAEVAEAYADGLATAEQLQFAEKANRNVAVHTKSRGAYDGAMAAHYAVYDSPFAAAYEGSEEAASANWHATGDDTERLVQCKLVCCIFVSPFRPVTLNPAWQTANVRAFAQAIYDDRAFERMPILGDALEDAGCDNADILTHCRQPGVHVRGCWVVDLVLGKQ
jgi:hypothetical protein